MVADEMRDDVYRIGLELRGQKIIGVQIVKIDR